MIFTIVSNMEIKKNKKYVEQIKIFLENKNHTCKLANVYQDKFFNYLYEVPNTTNIIISLGGDGTVLQAAQNALELNIPIISFNTGTLGFLAEYKMQEMENVLSKIINNDYIIENRYILEVYKDNKLLDISFNDVVIAREGFSRIVSIETIVKNQVINKYRGDGIIISTATGSTAYNLSLGGPILSPTCNNIIITPIACHSLLSRSIILNGDEDVLINILKSRKTQEKEAILTVDGRKNIDLHNDDSIYVKPSNKKVKIIKLNSNFFDLCNKKLKDNF